MKVTIEKIQIDSFGKLKNLSVTANEGINILSAPNESGKSTLAAFIKFAFYGFTGARMQNLGDNERKLYTPWDGEVSSGSIIFTADNVKYILSRRCLASGKEECKVVNYSTGKAEFTGEVPGEAVFGVGEEIFSRTLFFRQLSLPQSKDDILADRLKDIAISADEQVSTERAVKRLTEAKNELKGRGGNGIIPAAQRELEALDADIAEAMEVRSKTGRLRVELNKRNSMLEANKAKLQDLENERKNIEKYEAYQKLQSINRLHLEEELAREEYERQASCLKQQADGNTFGGLSAKNTELAVQQRNCEKLKERISKLEDERKRIKAEQRFSSNEADSIGKAISAAKNSIAIFSVLALVIFIAAGVIYFTLSAAAAWGIIACGVAVLVSGFIIYSKPNSLAKKYGMANRAELEQALKTQPETDRQLQHTELQLKETENNYKESLSYCERLRSELASEIQKYADLKGNDDYGEKIAQILSASAAIGEKLAFWRGKKEAFDAAVGDIDIELLAEEARGSIEPERDRVAVDTEITFYTKQNEQLAALNRRDELELTAFEARSGDPAALTGKQQRLSCMITDLSLKHKAYETAIQFINESGDHMKSRIAPRISERADGYFSAATGGKYNALEIDTRISMSFGEDFRRSCDYLSAGTRDSAYLSLRLALADTLFPDGAPIMLDDAFVRMDRERLGLMASALQKASERHQVFIFTHGEREALALTENNIAYNDIVMKTN